MPESFQIEAASAPRRGPRKHLLGLLVVCALLLAAVFPHQSLTGAAMAVLPGATHVKGHLKGRCTLF